MSDFNYSIELTALMIATESCAIGDVLVFDSVAGGWRVATAANRLAIGARSQAIALKPFGGSEFGKVTYRTGGVLAASISGLPELPPGAQRMVRVSATGRLERVSLVTPGDDIVGLAEWDGRVHLAFGFPWDQIPTGGAPPAIPGPPDYSVQYRSPLGEFAGAPSVSISADGHLETKNGGGPVGTFGAIRGDSEFALVVKHGDDTNRFLTYRVAAQDNLFIGGVPENPPVTHGTVTVASRYQTRLQVNNPVAPGTQQAYVGVFGSDTGSPYVHAGAFLWPNTILGGQPVPGGDQFGGGIGYTLIPTRVTPAVGNPSSGGWLYARPGDNHPVWHCPDGSFFDLTTGGGGGTPAGLDTSIQYNNGGAFGGSSRAGISPTGRIAFKNGGEAVPDTGFLNVGYQAGAVLSCLDDDLVTSRDILTVTSAGFTLGNTPDGRPLVLRGTGLTTNSNGLATNIASGGLNIFTGPGGAEGLRTTVDVTSTQTNIPRYGLQTAWGASEGDIAIANAPPYALNNIQYVFAILRFTNAAGGTYTFPSPNAGQSYIKYVQEVGGSSKTITTGAGTTFALAANTSRTLKFTNLGVFEVETPTGGGGGSLTTTTLVAGPAGSVPSVGVGNVESAGAAQVLVSGLVAPPVGQAKTVTFSNNNTGGFNLVLSHESGFASAAADRFQMPDLASLSIKPGETFAFSYCHNAARWRRAPIREKAVTFVGASPGASVAVRDAGSLETTNGVAISIPGLVRPAPNEATRITITNNQTGGTALTLLHESGLASAAGDRFDLAGAANLVIQPGEMYLAAYSHINSRWRISKVGTGGGGAGNPAAPFNSIQYNNAGVFGGSSKAGISATGRIKLQTAGENVADAGLINVGVDPGFIIQHLDAADLVTPRSTVFISDDDIVFGDFLDQRDVTVQGAAEVFIETQGGPAAVRLATAGVTRLSIFDDFVRCERPRLGDGVPWGASEGDIAIASAAPYAPFSDEYDRAIIRLTNAGGGTYSFPDPGDPLQSYIKHVQNTGAAKSITTGVGTSYTLAASTSRTLKFTPSGVFATETGGALAGDALVSAPLRLDTSDLAAPGGTVVASATEIATPFWRIVAPGTGATTYELPAQLGAFFFIYNPTAFAHTFKVTAQTGCVVAATSSAWIYCTGTDYRLEGTA